MTNAIIISICSMLLLAYLSEISSQRTKVPAVLMLLFLGWLTGQVITLGCGDHSSYPGYQMDLS